MGGEGLLFHPGNPVPLDLDAVTWNRGGSQGLGLRYLDSQLVINAYQYPFLLSEESADMATIETNRYGEHLGGG